MLPDLWILAWHVEWFNYIFLHLYSGALVGRVVQILIRVKSLRVTGAAHSIYKSYFLINRAGIACDAGPCNEPSFVSTCECNWWWTVFASLFSKHRFKHWKQVIPKLTVPACIDTCMLEICLHSSRRNVVVERKHACTHSDITLSWFT